MTALLVAVLLAALVGSPHCAGMCGPFVAFYAGSAATPGRRWRPAPHVAYNGGRLLSYAALGALAGGLGAALDLAGARLAGVQRAAALVAGVLIIAWGTVALLAALGVRVGATPGSTALRGAIAAVLRRLVALPASARAAVVGIVSVLLPCGFLWAFVITAAGAGHPLGGALVMVAFWAGTLPVMAAVGSGIELLAGPLRRRLPVVTALALIVVGGFAVAGRLPMIGRDPAPGRAVPATVDEAARQVQEGDAAGACPHHAPR
ncbi:MAG: sulfite exporter TauE/SafE family protein [Acidobacteriota bacterium]